MRTAATVRGGREPLQSGEPCQRHRRLTAAGSPVRSVLAHPGYASTNLQTTAPVRMVKVLFRRILAPLAQSADQGALPQLYAATAPNVESGQFFGPDGMGELRGAPKQVPLAPAAADAETARRLWELSERLSAIRFPTPGRRLSPGLPDAATLVRHQR
ncbi:hypothetical protein ACTMTI_18650 [Nonomuraea sp. H19]|uniref:hypothetical protein n=1 Tax=Nonomuraea sp. H19 TaxID=3452206 RepID=UPI003F89D3FF